MTGLRVTKLDRAGLPALADALADPSLPNSDIGDFGRLFFRFEDELGMVKTLGI